MSNAFGVEFPSPAQPAALPPSSVEVTPAPQPPKRRRSAIMPEPALAETVADLEARLAKSLGVPVSEDGYAPDLFVKAVNTVHDKLVEVRDALDARQSELDEKEMALRAREKAVQAREQKAGAALALATSRALAAPPRGLLGLFRK